MYCELSNEDELQVESRSKKIENKEEYRGKGYAKKLLKALCGNYKQKYNKILVGVNGENIPFFVKQGFDNYEESVKMDNCNYIYYSKKLK